MNRNVLMEVTDGFSHGAIEGAPPLLPIYTSEVPEGELSSGMAVFEGEPDPDTGEIHNYMDSITDILYVDSDYVQIWSDTPFIVKVQYHSYNPTMRFIEYSLDYKEWIVIPPGATTETSKKHESIQNGVYIIYFRGKFSNNSMYTSFPHQIPWEIHGDLS